MPGQLRRSVLLRSSRHTRHSRRAHMEQHEGPAPAAADRHQHRMDNAGYITENERNKRQVNIPLTETGKGATVIPVEGPSCSPDVCRRARSKYNQEHGEQGPWHRKKTIFLIGTIVLLAVWVVVYAALSKMDML